MHFHLDLCFAPQRRALFRHRNFKKCSEREVLLAFSVANVLRASSRHNGVQFSISHLASWLRTRRFSEPTFRASRATNHWKNTVFRDCPTFSRTWIFFLRRLSLFDLLSSSLLFSDSSHLCFSSVHIVGSLTSKRPSINGEYMDYKWKILLQWTMDDYGLINNQKYMDSQWFANEQSIDCK